MSQHRGSQPLCCENSYAYRHAINQIEFDSSYVVCETHYPRWQLSGWHRGVVLKRSSHCEQHFKYILNQFSLSYSLSLHYKRKLEKCENLVPSHNTSGVATVPGGSSPGGNCLVAVVQVAIVRTPLRTA